jgi:hypothetical protein
MGGQLHAPAALPLGKEHPVPIGKDAAWASEPVLDAVEKRKIPSPCRESNPQTPIVRPLASRCTNWATVALTSTTVLCSIPVMLTTNNTVPRIETGQHTLTFIGLKLYLKYNCQVPYFQGLASRTMITMMWHTHLNSQSACGEFRDDSYCDIPRHS